MEAAIDFPLMHDGKAFVGFVLAYILSLGFPLPHTSTCPAGGSLTRCALPLPADLWADAQPSTCRTDTGSLPTLVSGRGLWPLDDRASTSAGAFTTSDGALQRAAPKMPARSTGLAQAHHAIDRTRCTMKGLHHVGESPAALRTGLAPLSTRIPSQRRARSAGLSEVEVAGGRVPTSDGLLTLHLLASGGSRYAPEPPHHYISGLRALSGPMRGAFWRCWAP